MLERLELFFQNGVKRYIVHVFGILGPGHKTLLGARISAFLCKIRDPLNNLCEICKIYLKNSVWSILKGLTLYSKIRPYNGRGSNSQLLYTYHSCGTYRQHKGDQDLTTIDQIPIHKKDGTSTHSNFSFLYRYTCCYSIFFRQIYACSRVKLGNAQGFRPV